MHCSQCGRVFAGPGCRGGATLGGHRCWVAVGSVRRRFDMIRDAVQGSHRPGTGQRRGHRHQAHQSPLVRHQSVLMPRARDALPGVPCDALAPQSRGEPVPVPRHLLEAGAQRRRGQRAHHRAGGLQPCLHPLHAHARVLRRQLERGGHLDPAQLAHRLRPPRRKPFDEGCDGLVDGRAADTMRVGPLPCHQTAVPARQRSWGDQPVCSKLPRQESGQCRKEGTVGPVETWLRVATAQRSNLMTQNEQLLRLSVACLDAHAATALVGRLHHDRSPQLKAQRGRLAVAMTRDTGSPYPSSDCCGTSRSTTGTSTDATGADGRLPSPSSSRLSRTPGAELQGTTRGNAGASDIQDQRRSGGRQYDNVGRRHRGSLRVKWVLGEFGNGV